jgi:hypothetical protein
MYSIKIKFKDRHFDVIIKPKPDDGYDLEVGTRGRLSGDQFQALKKYLEDEGYIDQSREFLKT